MVSNIRIHKRRATHKRIIHRGSGVSRAVASKLISVAGHALVNKFTHVISGTGYRLAGSGVQHRKRRVRRRIKY